MAFYSDTRSTRGAVIGTIIPWSGGITSIPDGWIICDGRSLAASEYPLLAQTIGNTYNEGGASPITGDFPNYFGNVKLPSLTNRILMDIEQEYFDPGQTSTPEIDEAPKAASIIQPLIGENNENSIPQIYTDVTTNIEFSIPFVNEEFGYVGKITGNDFLPGEGAKALYVGPRKLGRDHVRFHSHSGSLPTLRGEGQSQPGRGVIPYESVYITLYFQVEDFEGGENVGDVWVFGWNNSNNTEANRRPGLLFGREADLGPGFAGGGNLTQNDSQWWEDRTLAIWPTANSLYAYDGTNAPGALPGRIAGKIRSESPPINLKPANVVQTPITLVNFLDNIVPNTLIGGSFVNQLPAGTFGTTLNVPGGSRNYDVDDDGNPIVRAGRGTLSSNNGFSFQGNDTSDRIIPHDHADFEVIYDASRLKTQRSLISNARLDSGLTMDNTANQSALQVNFNVTQPTLTQLYIIRAY